MARLTGTGGQVDAASEVTGIKSWTIDYIYDTYDGTGFDSSAARVFVIGLSSWSGSFEGVKNGAPLTIGSSLSIALKESQTASQKFTGTAFVTGLHSNTSVDGIVTYSYDFQGTGTLTIPTG